MAAHSSDFPQLTGQRRLLVGEQVVNLLQRNDDPAKGENSFVFIVRTRQKGVTLKMEFYYPHEAPRNEHWRKFTQEDAGKLVAAFMLIHV